MLPAEILLPKTDRATRGCRNYTHTNRSTLCDYFMLSGPKYASQKRSGLKTQFSIRHFRAGIRRSTRFETRTRPAIRLAASIFDRYAASTRRLLDMFRFNFYTKSGKDKKPIKIRPATQNTQRVEISIRNTTRTKRSGSGPLRLHVERSFLAFFGANFGQKRPHHVTDVFLLINVFHAIKLLAHDPTPDVACPTELADKG